MPYLRYVRITRLRPDPPKPRLYEVSFRDGTTMEVPAQAIDRAMTRHANILAGVEVATDLDSYEARLMNSRNYTIAKPETSTSRRYGDDFSSTSSDNSTEDGSPSAKQPSSGEQTASGRKIPGTYPET
jgi:hypothetical protein